MYFRHLLPPSPLPPHRLAPSHNCKRNPTKRTGYDKVLRHSHATKSTGGGSQSVLKPGFPSRRTRGETTDRGRPNERENTRHKIRERKHGERGALRATLFRDEFRRNIKKNTRRALHHLERRRENSLQYYKEKNAI